MGNKMIKKEIYFNLIQSLYCSSNNLEADVEWYCNTNKTVMKSIKITQTM